MIHRAVQPTARTRRRPRRDQRGAAVLEFALVAPLFFLVIFGLVTFGMILAKKQSITNAAADGARAAVGQANPAAAAQARVQAALGAPGAYTATYVPGACSGGTGNCITVTITYDNAGHPLVPTPINSLVPTITAKAVVQYS